MSEVRVPDGWREVSLGEAISFEYGKALPKKGRENGPFRVYGSNGIVGSHIDYLVLGPGIVVGRKGTAGSVNFVKHNFWPIDTTYYVDMKVDADLRFFYYLLKNLRLPDFNEATGIPGLNRNTVYRANILLPPLPEQRRIAEILSSVDDAIAATQAVLDQTRTVKQAVLKRLLTKGIGHTRFKQTEIGEIPEAWEVRPLGQLCTLTNGNGFRPPDWSDQGLPIIRIQNLNGSRNFNYFAGTPKEKWIVNLGDLLFSWAGVRGVSFGPCLWEGPRGVLNQHIFKVHPCEGISLKWLFHAMELVTARIEQKAHGFKDSLLHVHKSEITGQLVGVPHKDEQGKIVEALHSLRDAEDRASNQLVTLQSVKSALMSDLLTGRKRVPAALLSAAE